MSKFRKCLFISFLIILSCNSENKKDLRFKVFQFYKNGDYQSALQVVNKLLIDYPNENDFYYLRSRIYFKKKEYLQSENDIRKAIGINSGVPEYYFIYGEVLIKNNKAEEAIKAFIKCTTIDTLYADAYREYAGLLNIKGNYDSAYLYINKAIRINPHSPENYNIRGITQEAKSNYYEAIKDYSLSIKLGFNSYEVFLNRAASYAHIGEFKLAIDDLNRVISIDSSIGIVFCNRGYMYYQLNNIQNACLDWSKGLELNNPDSKTALEKYCTSKKI